MAIARRLLHTFPQGSGELLRGAGYVVLNKLPGFQLQPPQFRQGDEAASGFQPPQFWQGDEGTSGAAFIATSEAVAAEASALWKARQVVEVYSAVVRGHFPLNDLIQCHRRLCKPSEASTAWRLAGSRREGRDAFTLARGLRHGRYEGEPCTLVELRPVSSRGAQQLQLHCVALGHPMLGDELHSADRRLDWRFDTSAPQTPRLMLHCQELRVPLRQGSVSAFAPDALNQLLDVHKAEEGSGRSFDRQQSMPRLADVEVKGLDDDGHVSPNPWVNFCGGLSEGAVSDTHWDAPLRMRPIWGPPYGPPQFDDRARRRESDE